jgi:hypothetical protein
MAEVEIAGGRYRINRMNVFDQAHVARKVAPIWFTMMGGYAEIANKAQQINGHLAMANGEDEGGIPTQTMFEVMMPISEILAKMTDDDVNYVIFKCLSVCDRWNGSNWAKMAQGTTLMFQETTTLEVLINLVMAVVNENLAPFLPGLLGGQSSPAEDSPSPSSS